MNPIAEQYKVIDFDSIRLKLASPEVIRNWSYGEVTNPETINYRTQKPEKGGLFAEEIFGPSKDWECYCGKYKKVRYKGIICDKCGVEVTYSLVRRERMGHIELAAPVSHIWFLRGVPSKIGLVLDLTVQSLEKVIYFANFIVTEVREDAKKETEEMVRAEYKGKKKQYESEYARQLETVQKNGSLSAADKEAKSGEAFDAKSQRLKDLDEEFTATIKEIKEIKPLKIISEQTYQEWSLKWGHLFEAGIGAEAIRDLLSRVDVDAETAKLSIELGNEPQGQRYDKLVRRMKLFHSFKTNGLMPDWMVMTVVPVIPPDLRPMVPLDGGRFAASDLNDLYRRVINRNNRLNKLADLNAPEVITRNEKRMLQEAVDALIDNSARQSKTVVATTGKKRQLKSLADMLKGKQGRFRQNLLGKRVDYSGRSVIVVGPYLKLNQCGIPKMMALELFKPFVISKLISRGYVHNIRSANRFIEASHPEVWDILEEVTRDSLVLLNRAPTLHRLGIQAFQPVLIEGKAINIHPMACTAFNADFDGDQMAVHVPLTEEACAEARDLLLSTQNLLKPATGQPIMRPDKDVVWGIFYLTTTAIQPEGARMKCFADEQEAIAAYRLQKVGLREPMRVRIAKVGGPMETTVGRILFNRTLPDEWVYLNESYDAKRITDMVRRCLDEFGRDRTVKFLDDLKDLGFHYITVSGYSWGMAELPSIEEKHELLVKGDREVEEIEKQYADGLLTDGERHQQIVKTWTRVKDEVTKIAKKKLSREGAVGSMIESGARGAWSQMTQIIGMKGPVANPSGDIIELPIKANFKDGLDVLEYFISTHGARKGLSDTALRTANAGYLTRRLVDVSQDIVIRAEDCVVATGKPTVGIEMTAEESEAMNERLHNRIQGRWLLENLVDEKTGKVVAKGGTLITDEVGKSIADADLRRARVRSVLECRMARGICAKCYGYDLAYNRPVEQGVAVGIIAAQSIGEPGTQLTMRTFHTGGVAGSDITQGLPRVEELFEARPPKRKAYLSESDGKVTVEEIERRTIEGPDGKKMLAPFVGHKIVRVAYAEMDGETYKAGVADEIKVKDGDEVIEGQIIVLKGDRAAVVAKAGGKAKVSKRAVRILRETKKEREYIVPPGFVLLVKTGDMVRSGEQLTDGHVDLQQLFRLKGKDGKDAVQRYILKEVMQIYYSQGQKLNNKHIEIIIRQMFSRGLVKDAGDTELLPGEIVEKAQLIEENDKAEAAGLRPATFEELFLGITKVSLSTQSFLSAASFQETARVLINAAITGKVDNLSGLKENVIIGRLIPAGTGILPPTVVPTPAFVPVDEELPVV
jgi:DNA-directed RNA polymerase subunit beta'